MKIKTLLASCALSLLLVPLSGSAQWLTQSLKLVPGWNAVYLEVQPEPRSCADVFKGLPIQSVWKWDRRFTTIQFTVDPASLMPETPDWQVWLPPTDAKAFLTRLWDLQGGEAYLIRVASNAAPFTLPLKGRVLIPHLNWYPHGLNLVGLPVSSNAPPTFSDFFKFTPEVDTTRTYANQLYKLDSQGHGQQIVQPSRDRPQAGVAYWVGCAKTPAYQSALNVTTDGGDAVDFGLALTRRDLSIKNVLTNAPMTVWLRQLASEAPPATGTFPELAGPVPLSYSWKNASNQWVWSDFPAGGLSHTLAPGETWAVRLGVRRSDFAAYSPQGTNSAAYLSILEVSDGAQSLRLRVPVSAQKEFVVQKATSQSVTPQDSTSSDFDAEDENQGLWVGTVSVNQVSAPAYTGTNLLSTPAPMSFRLLVHVDGYGQARLLQQVVLAWDSTLTEAPHTNGTYALYSDDTALPSQPSDVSRISSAAFAPMAPLALSGAFSNALAGEVVVGFSDPCNPFLHRYHPMHDNLDANYQPYTNAVETRTIIRDITLTFNAVTNASADPFYGVDNMSGVYQETLSGLRAQPINLQGAFSLQRISRINQLRGITQ